MTAISSWPDYFHRLDTFDSPLGPITAWHSRKIQDPLWDDFLIKTPLGQFQQSSMWAEYKKVEGWQAHRLVLTDESRVIGGCQILWKQTRLGRIGYASKGPVAVPETAEMANRLLSLMCDQARLLGLRAFIVQPPDESRIESESFDRLKFITSNPLRGIECTYLVDVSRGPQELEKGMSRKSARRNVRLTKAAGVFSRPGRADEVAVFFQLMQATCQRQHTKPNPSSLERMRQLWQSLAKSGCAQMVFAQHDEVVLAGLFLVLFGQKATIWKKGWNAAIAKSIPMTCFITTRCIGHASRVLSIAIAARLTKALPGR